MAVDIGSQKQILVDDYIVEDTWDVERRVIRPAKHPRNPLLVMDRKWEDYNVPDVAGGGPGITSAVLWDPEERLYKLWYQICRMVYWKTLHDKEYTYMVGYAVSKDGIVWEKPDVGVVEFEGSRSNNILMKGEYWATPGTVLKDPRQSDPARRYTMLYNDVLGMRKIDELRSRDGKGAVCIAHSSDGVHWTPYGGNPVMREESDTMNTVFWDQKVGRYVCYMRPRVYAGNWKRRIARTESDDMIHWDFPDTVLVPDEADPVEVYGMPVFPYAGMYFGLLQMYDSDQKENIDVQLAWSRDGKRWDRLPTRPVFLGRSSGQEVGSGFDKGMVFCAPPIRVADELWFYYGGADGSHAGWGVKTGIGLAVSKTDRLVARKALEGRLGTILTRTFRCDGEALQINASSSNGWVQTEVLEKDGTVIEGFDRQSSVPFSGDALGQNVAWKGERPLAQLRGREIRLKFYLTNAELYAFQVTGT
jgi:predicted GH43/DUF377 family glycosyl hydrolase